jgi:hypothetical protein
MTVGEELSVGVLVNPHLWEWQVQALENIQSLDGVHIELVVANERKRSSEDLGSTTNQLRHFAKSLLSGYRYPIVLADQRIPWLFSLDNAREAYLDTVFVEDVPVLSDVDVVWCTPIAQDGSWESLPDETVDRVVDTVDVVVRLGFGLLTGRLIEEPEYGVLSAHGSDIRRFRGLGPQLSFLYDNGEVSVTLQELSEEIDGGKVVCLLTRELEEPYTLSDVWAAVRELQTELYAEGIDKVRRDGYEPSKPQELGEYYSQADKNKLRFIASLVAKNNMMRLRKLQHNVARAITVVSRLANRDDSRSAR